MQDLYHQQKELPSSHESRARGVESQDQLWGFCLGLGFRV